MYILLNVEVLDEQFSEVPEWTKAFLALFATLKGRSIPTAVKIALVSYRTDILKGSGLDEVAVLDLRKDGQGTMKKALSQQRKRRKQRVRPFVVKG